MLESLYVSNKKELSRVLLWAGLIIFWLTFWLPQGLFLGGNATSLGVFFPQMEIVLPAFSFGIILMFSSQCLAKFSQKIHRTAFFHGAKTAGLWLAIILIISFFSRDLSSGFFVFVWLIGMLTISLRGEFFPQTLQKRQLMAVGVLIGLVVYKFFPELYISIDLLAMVSVFGLVFLSDEIPRNFRSRDFMVRLLMQGLYLFVIFQSANLVFPIAALLVLIFSRKLFIFRRGQLSPDFLSIGIFILFLILRLYFQGIDINLSIAVPHVWSNFREILLGVGQGQFLPAMQQTSEHLLPLSAFKIPNSSFLLTLFEQGILGVLAILLLFIFSLYLHKRRSFLYTFLIILLWIFSVVFMSSENGIILLILLLFLDTEKIISREL